MQAQYNYNNTVTQYSYIHVPYTLIINEYNLKLVEDIISIDIFHMLTLPLSQKTKKQIPLPKKQKTSQKPHPLHKTSLTSTYTSTLNVQHDPSSD